MIASRKTWSFGLICAVLSFTGAAGCSLKPHEDVEIHKRYELGNSPSAECVDAAKRATYWCEGSARHTSADVQSKCSTARWDHARAC